MTGEDLEMVTGEQRGNYLFVHRLFASPEPSIIATELTVSFCVCTDRRRWIRSSQQQRQQDVWVSSNVGAGQAGKYQQFHAVELNNK